ncbi:hypothetical protein SUGI_1075480 [Cryptomeria japonica]|nr:hypothetical protein SUGI_1075480 [Cryptomeria japonica]
MKRMNLCIFNHLKLKVLVFRVSQFWYRGKARMKRMKVALQILSEESSLPSYDDIQPLETQGYFFIFLFSFAGFFIYSTHRQSLSPWDVGIFSFSFLVLLASSFTQLIVNLCLPGMWLSYVNCVHDVLFELKITCLDLRSKDGRWDD